MKTLILGGVKSGKSRQAETLAKQASDQTGGLVTVIVTAEAIDSEMAQRIQAHQLQRPAHWKTIETPIELAQSIIEAQDSTTTIIVDCLTIWLNNLLHHLSTEELEQQITRLLQVVDTCTCNLIFVGNETNMGIMPINELARRYADLAGGLHQKLAQKSDHVTLMVAGLPLTIK